jgi:hypothetical protein
MSWDLYEFNPNKTHDLRIFYDQILNLNRTNFIPYNFQLPEECLGISNIPNQFLNTDLTPCCLNGYFTTTYYYPLSEIYNKETIAGVFVFCKIFMYFLKNVQKIM